MDTILLDNTLGRYLVFFSLLLLANRFVLPSPGYFRQCKLTSLAARGECETLSTGWAFHPTLRSEYNASKAANAAVSLPIWSAVHGLLVPSIGDLSPYAGEVQFKGTPPSATRALGISVTAALHPPASTSFAGIVGAEFSLSRFRFDCFSSFRNVPTPI